MSGLPYDPRTGIAIILCPTVAELPVNRLVGAEQIRCPGCQQLIWIAPASIDLMQREEIPAMCSPCGTNFVLEAEL